ncbi:peptidoglycan recognition protein 5 isoform X1 [Erpetoichthys calabaricus]|uniref:Peptidoglycan-recognition protein n=2 Tax=Erpetoichthys calabaricus TaxID=27687 RepID=A0A8C4RCE4_ERPCA|nr:peptidoglycan recognition protein 5 isoform X1 [Erpetoichthys calabaricus]
MTTHEVEADYMEPTDGKENSPVSSCPTLLSTVSGKRFQCFRLMCRKEWGALPPKLREPMKVPSNMVIIHHTAMDSCLESSSCIEQLRQIQRLHMDTNGWNDIGYNFLIGQNGMVYEGRGWGIEGAHAKNYNNVALGIAIMGNFENEFPSLASLSSVQKVLQHGVLLDFLHPDFILKTHRNVSNTKCPGENLYNIIKNWPNFAP